MASDSGGWTWAQYRDFLTAAPVGCAWVLVWVFLAATAGLIVLKIVSWAWS